MIRLGFVSAILPELELAEVLGFAGREGFACVELMCWPKGKAERRYAGVTHLDAAGFDQRAADGVRALLEQHRVAISGLGYYPNPLAPDPAEAQVYVEHIKCVIRAARLLGVGQVNTFVGRDWTKSTDAQWPRFLSTWRPLVAFAEEQGVRIGIENCPMLFTGDEWPGGKNLATSPAVWRRMFADIPSRSFGLNFDPSHFVWQQMDYLKPLREFRERIFHVHAKDARVDRERLDEVGILATPLQFHTPKLPGLGEVDWGRFFSVLGDTGYDGPVCVEVEDRAYEGSLESRQQALRQSLRYLRGFAGASFAGPSGGRDAITARRDGAADPAPGGATDVVRPGAQPGAAGLHELALRDVPPLQPGHLRRPRLGRRLGGPGPLRPRAPRLRPVGGHGARGRDEVPRPDGQAHRGHPALGQRLHDA